MTDAPKERGARGMWEGLRLEAGGAGRDRGRRVGVADDE